MKYLKASSSDDSAGAARLPVRKYLTSIPILLLIAALLIGGYFRIDYMHRPFTAETHENQDVKRYYLGPAESFLSGTGWETPLKYNFIPPPLQSVFIVLVKWSMPQANYHTMRTVQAVLSIITIYLAFLIGRQLGGEWTGALAALLLALDMQVVRLVGYLLAENNYFLLLFAFLALTLYSVKRPKCSLWGVTGVLLGLTSLMKPFPMFLAIVIPAYVILRYRTRRWLLAGATMLACFCLTVSPWVIRNYLKYDRVYLISTNAGILLAQSNNKNLDPGHPDHIYWNSIRRKELWQDPEIEKEFAGVKDEYGKAEWNLRDRAYMRHTGRYVLDNPLHFLRNYAIKIYNVLWFPVPPTGHRWEYMGHYRRILVLLGLAGAVVFAVRERRKPRLIFLVIFLYFLAFSALMHMTRGGRINLPMKLFLTFFTAYLISAWRPGRDENGPTVVN